MKNHLFFLILVGECCRIVSSEPDSEVTYYVKPTNGHSTECPGQPCQTLNYYLKNIDTTINGEMNLSMIYLNSNHSIDVQQIGIPIKTIKTPFIRMVGQGDNVTIIVAEKLSFVLEFTQNYEIYLKNLVLVDFYLLTKSSSDLPTPIFHMSSLKVFDVQLRISDFKIFVNNSELRGGLIWLPLHSVLKMCNFVQVLVQLFSKVEIEDCTFFSTPLQVFTGTDVLFTRNNTFAATERGSAISSYFGGNITLSGNVIFANNSAARGGAMALYMSTLKIAANTSVTFVNNSAYYKGGAIYVEPGIPPNMVLNLRDVYVRNSKSFIGDLSCFYQLLNCSNNSEMHNFHFVNNSAVYGGDDVYGVSLSYSDNYRADCSLTVSITSNSNSSVSSDALRVCICDDDFGVPQCTNNSFNFLTADIHPGEMFKISAVLVGVDFGLTTGIIYADIIPSNYSIPPKIALKSDYSDHINDITQCHEIEYSLYSQDNTFVTVLFTAVPVDSPYHRRSPCNDVACFQIATVSINFTILPCPLAFTLTQDPNGYRCDCYHLLTDLHISCQIINGEGYFSWTGNNLWVNIVGTEGALYSEHCPHNYCKSLNGNENINLQNDSAYQCEFNRTGILCGECKEGYSLAIGSYRCIHCPNNNNNFALLIFFAAAGFLLVIFVVVLNLTVTSSAINGVIFYANIIWTYKDIFFTSKGASSAVLIFLKTFIAWVNLDFGIEICFVRGLTAFWKTWLQFVFPFYIWAIAGSIILASRYSFRLTKLLGNRAVPLLATLFLLSYMKLLRTVVSTLEFSILTRFDYSREASLVVWSLDGSLYYFGFPHILLFIAGLFTLLFLWLPYTLLLFLMQWLRRLPHVGIIKWIMRLHPLYDSYFAPLKPKHQYWFGVLLLARGILLIMFASSFSIPKNINLLLLVIFGMLLVIYLSLTHPYKNRAVLLLNASYIINLTLLGVSFFFTYTQPNATSLQSIAIGLSTGAIFLQFCGIVLAAIIRPCCFKSKTNIEPASPHYLSISDHREHRSDISGYRESILNETDPLITTKSY